MDSIIISIVVCPLFVHCPSTSKPCQSKENYKLMLEPGYPETKDPTLNCLNCDGISTDVVMCICVYNGLIHMLCQFSECSD